MSLRTDDAFETSSLSDGKKYTHVYLGYSKVYYLNATAKSKRNRIDFTVIDAIELRKSKSAKSIAKMSKWQSDMHLLTAREWEASKKEVTRIGKLRLSIRKDVVTDKHAVPHRLPFQFPKMTQAILSDIKNDANVYLVGGSGVGKTTIIQQIATRLNIPCVRIQTSSGVTVESFVGGYVPGAGGKAVWADGLLTQAARKGWWVILDEWDFAPAHIRTICNGLLEVHNRQLILTDKDGGETLTVSNGKLHPDFRVFATGNTAGCMQDEADHFGGYADPNQAQLSRWNIYRIEYLTDKELYKVLRDNVPEVPVKAVKSIVKSAKAINDAKIPGIYFSTRVALACATKMKHGLKFLEAMEPVLLNHVSKAEKARILQLVTNNH